VATGKCSKLRKPAGRPRGTSLRSTLSSLQRTLSSQSAWLTPDLRRQLTSVIKRGKLLGGHNIPVDVDQLMKVMTLPEEIFRGDGTRDSLLLARMHDENRGKGSYKLENLLLAEFNTSPWKSPTENLGMDATKWDAGLRASRCATDAWASAILVDRFSKALSETGVSSDVVNFTHRIAMTLHRMYLAGAIVDMKTFNKIADELSTTAARSRDTLIKAAFKLGMREFSPTNDNDLRELLFKRMRFEVLRRTPKDNKPAVDSYTLKQFEKEHPIVKILLEFNRADKLYSTWHGSDERTSKRPPLADTIRPFLARHGDYGFLPFHINALGARTSRRSSGRSEETDDAIIEAPNSQNWPKPLRKIIVSRFKGGRIGNFDYSKLEVVLFAWLAKDERLFEYFTKGKGYIDIARDFFHTTVEKDTSRYTLVKSTALAVQYNAGDWQLATQLWYKLGIKLAGNWRAHLDKVHDMRVKYLKMFPGIPKFIRQQERELLETQQVKSLTGRIRHLFHHFRVAPGRGDDDYGAWKHLLNEAVNAPVQGLASEVTGSAEIDVEGGLVDTYSIRLSEYHAGLLAEYESVLKGEKFEPFPMTRLINEVHDCVVADMHPDHIRRDTELIVETMRAVPTLRRICPAFTLKLDLEPKIGPVWGG